MAFTGKALSNTSRVVGGKAPPLKKPGGRKGPVGKKSSLRGKRR